MNREELSLLIESYRDGSLAAADGQALLDAIRGDEGNWVLEQLAMMNHIDHACDQVSEDAFVTSLLERMEADRNASKFVRDLDVRRQSKERHSSNRLQRTETPSGRFGRRSKFWFSLSLALIVGFFLLIRQYLAPVEAARVLLSLDAKVQHGDRPLSPRADDIIYSGDLVATGPGGRMHIVYGDDSLLELNGSAKARIEVIGGAKRIVLESGDLYLSASHQIVGKPWTIQTRTALLTVVGTEFEVSLTADSTRLRVVKGAVSLENAVNKVSVTAGEESTALASSRINDPISTDVEKIAAWRNRQKESLPTSDGLVAHWTCDDVAGEALSDASGNGHDGELVCEDAASVWTSEGKTGGALSFDGLGDFVDIPNAPGLENIQEGSFTVAAWFKPADVPTHSDPDMNGLSDNYAICVKTGKHEGIIYTNRQQFMMCHWFGGPAVGSSIVSKNTFAPGDFHHVAGVVDQEAGTTVIYVDGHIEGTDSWKPGTAAKEFGTATWKIGIGQPRSTSQSWNWAAIGTVDDVRLYDRALTANEISGLARATDN